MKKAALLSFHTAYNYGAALQAYALQEAVKDIGVDCEYINYINTFRKDEYNMFYQLRREIKKRNVLRVCKLFVGIPFMTIRKVRFEKFYNKYIYKTPKVYKTSEEAQTLNENYDKFIVGSDQVWNPDNNGSDFAYLLDFVEDNSKKISYSSSFGVSELPEHLVAEYSTRLKEFHRITTREAAGVKLIKELSDRDAHLVLDPVFLPNRKVWEGLISTVQKNKTNYIFFYTNRSTQLNDFLELDYPTKKLDFHVLSSHVTPREFIIPKYKVKFSMSPEKFLEEISSAKLVVTASFHCLAFSIIMHKQFLVFLTGNKGKDERMLNILRICNLEDRVLRHDMTQSEIDAPINYDDVDRKIKLYKEDSITYLANAIFDYSDIDYNCNRIVTSIERIRKNDFCTGCGACAISCPRHAIIMKQDNEGFLFPNINTALCNNCGLCCKKCQLYIDYDKDVYEQKYYGVKNTDDIRVNSSSGGVFTALAKAIFAEGGVVCAAAMNADFVVRHTFATCYEQLATMKGTYYVQSDLGDSFIRAKEYLASGTKVLFVGTPCQVCGLKLFLGRKYDNLISADIICHGVPSPMVFAEFINFLKQRGKVSEYKFRDKSDGWAGYHVTAVIDEIKYTNTLWLQSFNKLFSHNLINRRSCGTCRYANYNRQGDITIGDFWGIHRVLPEYADNLGVSLVLINTYNGERLFNHCDGLQLQEVTKESTYQNSLLQPARTNPKRSLALAVLDARGYEKLAKKYGENNIIGNIKTIIRKSMYQKK